MHHLSKWLLAAAITAPFWPAVATYSQTITPAPVDVSAVTGQVAQASAQAASAVSTAQAAQTAANAAVKTVGGVGPDASGNAALPNAFTGISCSGCTMSSPVLTGSPALNGSPIATQVDIASVRAALNAYVPPVSSVNGLTGSVNVPVYTDAQAIAANSSVVATATSLARAAAADVIQVAVPTSGGTVSAATGTNVLFINNGALLASLTVVYPPNPVDGQRFTVAANNTITTIGFSGATSRGAVSTLAVSGYARFVWSAAIGVWFRVG